MGSLHASQKWSLTWKKIFFVVNHQNIGCKLLPKEEKNWKFETWPFTHYQTRSSILKHCVQCLQFFRFFIKLQYSASVTFCEAPLNRTAESFQNCCFSSNRFTTGTKSFWVCLFKSWVTSLRKKCHIEIFQDLWGQRSLLGQDKDKFWKSTNFLKLLTPNTPLIQLWCARSQWNMDLKIIFSI